MTIDKAIPILEDLLKSAICTCNNLSVEGETFRETKKRIEEQAEALKIAIETLKRGEENDSSM